MKRESLEQELQAAAAIDPSQAAEAVAYPQPRRRWWLWYFFFNKPPPHPERREQLKAYTGPAPFQAAGLFLRFRGTAS
jgi:hypothetical protein